MPSRDFQIICKDYLVSKEEFQLRLLNDFEILETLPKPENLAIYYESENYISHTDAKKSLTDKIYQGVKNYMLQQKLKWINSIAEGNKILDIGAGTGDFLFSAKKQNWIVAGVEPNTQARKLALEKGIELQKDSANFKENSFDVISMWHVLEHVPNLDIQIEELNRLLKPGGIAVIAVPNFKSFDAAYYQEFWAAYDVPRHLWHFSQAGITKLFESYNFKKVETRPLIFDAFYVSLLSEKNRSGKSNFLKALKIGGKSNLKARHTSEYSSLTYFFQKD
ncbi:Ubiquinone/menaquinone biosynthesis C-methylase UbiE [Salegentibacter echinorum]|uniref:Ubiquinone/menaquinone biosynthesis C-methylase UbiE n=1 Tax=Salegentibacter echinorum TaxID=1073325 RepID=A0A1M5DXN2_SALEC|nr:class I SAM-dependent methyltransferase [Salegentibacter echinorum]SHF71705.1 Ubiquinone/menaquinone biosynthesis C-methylase UbiE [Salegentibacter echinorum]